MRNEVVIIQRIFPNYRREVFDFLQKYIAFKVLHSRHQNGVPEVKSKYSKKILSIHYAKKESNLFLNVFPYILKKRPSIIIHEFSIGILSLLPTYLLAKSLGCKWILWGHGYDHSKGFDPSKSKADKFRLFLARISDAVVFYAPEAKAKYAHYLNANKLFVANNCLNTEKLSAIRDQLEAEGKLQVKERIGFRHRYNLIFIGRILENKKPQFLIAAAEILRKGSENDIAIHFVGDGPYLKDLNQQVESTQAKNIYFHGEIQDDEKTGEMLFASDMLVMPGYVGLSVNHALNFDCPVVTFKQKTEGPFHSPEISYVFDGKTGFIVENHTPKALAQTIEKYLFDPSKKDRMKTHIRDTVVNKCSIHHFTAGFKDAIDYSTNKSKEYPRLSSKRP
ncbi:MAG: glycosyltransferase family 4 protein [Saprospiraceae bacterium]|nr:glycosyltransferase family 4 protein [Saprospiraceae bacterium]